MFAFFYNIFYLNFAKKKSQKIQIQYRKFTLETKQNDNFDTKLRKILKPIINCLSIF